MLTKLSNKVVSDIALFVIRLILGVVFIAHAGFFAVVVSIVEFFGGIALILGLFSRWAGLLIAIDMIGATLFAKLKVGLIAPFDKPGVGFELDLALLGCALAILVFGPGRVSVELGLLKKELS
jgi:putative oxidoreductase